MKRWMKSLPLVTAMTVLQLFISCTKHIPVERNAEAWEKERLIYVTVLSGEKYQIKNPKIDGDFLTGMTPANIAAPGDKEIKIALVDIKQIEIERPDRTKTVIALLVVGLPVGYMIWFASQFAGGFQ